MPIYEYRCENGHLFEVMQKITEDPVTVCEECGAPVQRVFHPIAVHFKGKGFYNTDYGTKKRAREKDAQESSQKSDSSGDGKGEKKSESSTTSESSSASSSSDTAPSAPSTKPAKS